MGGKSTGRKPAPTRLKILKGVHKVNPNRINKHEPVPGFEYPTMPKEFVGDAKETWDWAIHCLSTMRILTENDLVNIEQLARAHHHWKDADDKIKELGQVAYTKAGLVVSPYVKIYMAMSDKVMKCLVELGLTPSSRTRLVVSPENRENNAQAQGLPSARARA